MNNSMKGIGQRRTGPQLSLSWCRDPCNYRHWLAYRGT